MIKTFKIAFGAFLVTAALLKTVPALAEPAVAPNVRIVQTADLDLSSPAGRVALDRRLIAAAAEVCGTPSDADLAGKNRARECRAEVLANARAATAQIASREAPALASAR